MILRLLVWLAVAQVAFAGCASAPPTHAENPATPAHPAPQSPAAPPGAEVPGELTPEPALRIAFGSCNDVAKPQVLWEPIAALSPAAFVWLGDIVYADTEDPVQKRALYEGLAAYPAYAQLAKQTRIVGTWDDHDYGFDNSGREYKKRAESQQVLLDFLGEPKDSARRTQEGVYTSVDLGTDPHRVRIILLDTRYHRDMPGPTGDVLGEAQWAWLEAQLKDSTAAVHLIGSSIQLVPEQHGFEKWGNFPSAKQRLIALLDRTQPKNTFVLSGDRHFGELSKLDRGAGHAAIYDLTSSSLSKPFGRAPEEENRYRIGATVWDVNFGLVEIDWSAGQARLQLRGRDNAIALDQVVPLTGLRARGPARLAMPPKAKP